METRSSQAQIGVLDAAQAKGVHEETVRRAIRAGRLAALRVGGRLVLRVADLDAWQPAYTKAPRNRTPGDARTRDAVSAGSTADGHGYAATARAGARRPPLPIPLSSFVGREHAVADIRHLLAIGRFVTLTGAGGVGKTRLAIEVASGLGTRFEGGVCFVDLAALTDSALVPQEVALRLGVRAAPGRPVTEALVDALHDSHLLLVLDNCEHLVAACADLARTLLSACPRLRILATSRVALGVPGEVVWLAPSLSLPEDVLHTNGIAEHRLTAERIQGSEAMRLFVERATAARRDFALTGQNAEAVARICRRLDGIPLALELAATWVSVLSVDEIAARLAAGLRLLTAGERAAPPRHRTMTAAIDASYQLLSEPERCLFEQLSVFAGGWTLAAAEAVAVLPAPDAPSASGAEDAVPDSTLDLLARLVAQSLVVVAHDHDGGLRYRLLEPVRQFAQERLAATGTASAIRDRHAAYFVDLVDQAQSGLWGPAGFTDAWVPRMAPENDNLRTALRWLLDRGDLDRAERLGAGLTRYWIVSGRADEGWAWHNELLAHPSSGRDLRTRGRLRVGAAAMAMYGYDEVACCRLGAEGLALARAAGDDWAVAYALFLLLTAELSLSGGSLPAAARERLEEGIAACRAAGDQVMEVAYLQSRCLVELAAGNDTDAEAAATSSLVLAEVVGTGREIGKSLGCLGAVAYRRGQLAAARDLFDRARMTLQQHGEKLHEAAVLWSLAFLATDQGDIEAARGYIAAFLDIWPRLGRPPSPARSLLQDCAYLAVAQGEYELALQVAGALEAAGGSPRSPWPYYGGSALDQRLETARAALGQQAATRAWEAGRLLSLTQVMDLVAHHVSMPARPLSPEPRLPGAVQTRSSSPLSPREREVAGLVAQGFSNRRIAEALVIAEATVERHISNIFGRLGLSSRAELAVWVTNHPRQTAG